MTEEQQLAERCKNKDELAFKELYDTYSRRLLALCVRYIKTFETAEDIIHDSFIKIFESIGTFRYGGAGSLYSWMSSIVVHKAVDRLRSEIRVTRVQLDDNIEDVDLVMSDVYSVPEKDLLEMIQSLPPGFRAVFNMYAIEGYSHKEIGRILGIKEKTSSSQYFRARTILASMINDYLRKNG